MKILVSTDIGIDDVGLQVQDVLDQISPREIIFDISKGEIALSFGKGYLVYESRTHAWKLIGVGL